MQLKFSPKPSFRGNRIAALQRRYSSLEIRAGGRSKHERARQ